MARGGITISPENVGPIVNVVSWICIVLSFLATLAKVWSKWILTQKLQPDDFYLGAALLTALGWVVAVSKEVEAGLGQHESALDADQLVRFQQTSYASQFLYVTSLCLAKMALLHFLMSLARVKNRRAAVYATIALNLASMVVGIFAVAFQCPLPQPWAILSNRCFSQTAFWIAFGVIDIVVDIATVLLPFFLLHDLRTTWKRKLPAILAFSLRFLLVPMIVARLVLLAEIKGSSDIPFDSFGPTLATAVHINFSVIFTCLPFLKTVLDSMQTGLLTGEVRGGSTQLTTYRSGRTGNHDGYGASVTTSRRQKSRDHGHIATADRESRGYNKLRYSASSEKMVINQTTTISLETSRRSR